VCCTVTVTVPPTNLYSSTGKNLQLAESKVQELALFRGREVTIQGHGSDTVGTRTGWDVNGRERHDDMTLAPFAAER
jgi:hypothetical protein